MDQSAAVPVEGTTMAPAQVTIGTTQIFLLKDWALSSGWLFEIRLSTHRELRAPIGRWLRLISANLKVDT